MSSVLTSEVQSGLKLTMSIPEDFVLPGKRDLLMSSISHRKQSLLVVSLKRTISFQKSGNLAHRKHKIGKLFPGTAATHCVPLTGDCPSSGKLKQGGGTFFRENGTR